MKGKLFGLLTLSILTILVFTSAVSATITFSGIPTLKQDGTSFEITITSDTAETIDFSTLTITDDNSKTISFTDLTGTIFVADTSQTITIAYTKESGFEFDFGKEYSTILTAKGSTSGNATQTLTFEETPYYKGDYEDDLDISDLEFDVLKGFGDDEDYWYPFDEVEITFNVENNGDYDIEDVEIEVCILDKEKGECVFDEDDMDIDVDSFNLDEGDDQDVTINFNVDADNLNEGNTEYVVYVRAIGTIDDKDAPDTIDNKETGTSDSQEIEITTDDDFVIIDDIKFEPTTVSCGDTVKLTADVWNVGDEDLDDDEVYVLVYNKELGINKVVDFDSGIDAMDSEELSLSLELPKDIEEKTYIINFLVYNDEDMDDKDIFETDEEEDEARYVADFYVKGSCVLEPQVIVTASLESGGKAGEELIIKATVTNTGNELTTYTLNAEEYTEWASLESVDPSTIILEAGKSKDVFITFNVNKDISGDKLFNIDVLSEGESILKQPVSVTIEKSEFVLSALTGNIISEGNWYLWGIGALNVLLVIIIILVAVRVAKKSE